MEEKYCWVCGEGKDLIEVGPQCSKVMDGYYICQNCCNDPWMPCAEYITESCIYRFFPNKSLNTDPIQAAPDRAD